MLESHANKGSELKFLRRGNCQKFRYFALARANRSQYYYKTNDENGIDYMTLRFFLPKVVFAIVLILNCFSDAPRDNPLDPANGVSFSGTVRRIYSNDVLQNASVRLSPGNRISITNSNGRYQFSDIAPGSYKALVFADGFSSDTAEVNIEKNIEINFSLDSLPYFRNVFLTTSHITHWFPPDDTYSIVLEATGYDGDGTGDIKVVWYGIESINFSDTLQRVAPGSNIFRGQAVATSLPLTNLHELIGKPFRFFIEDIPGKATESSPHFITRIIEETPQLISPVSLAIISSFPITFKWQPVTNVQFTFTQRIEIYSIGLGLKVDEMSSIASNMSEYIYSSPLSNGDYYWVLYIMDELGNQSGSKEGSFRVQL